MTTWRPEWTDQGQTKKWLKKIAYKERAIAMDVLRCIFHTKLVVPSSKVPSGHRYIATPGQIITVDDRDRETLLSMTRQQQGCPGCSGGRRDEAQHYFEEVSDN